MYKYDADVYVVLTQSQAERLRETEYKLTQVENEVRLRILIVSL